MEKVIISQWLRSNCCNYPLMRRFDFAQSLYWIHCTECCRRIGVQHYEEVVELDNANGRFIPNTPLSPYFP